MNYKYGALMQRVKAVFMLFYDQGDKEAGKGEDRIVVHRRNVAPEHPTDVFTMKLKDVRR